MQLAPPRLAHSDTYCAARDAELARVVNIAAGWANRSRGAAGSTVDVERRLEDDNGKPIDPTGRLILNLKKLIPADFFPEDQPQLEFRKQVANRNSRVFVNLANVFKDQTISTCTVESMAYFMRILEEFAYHRNFKNLFITRGHADPEQAIVRSFNASYFDSTQHPRGHGITALWARDMIKQNHNPKLERFVLIPTIVRLTLNKHPMAIDFNQRARNMLRGESYDIWHDGHSAGKIAPNYHFGSNPDSELMDWIRMQDGRVIGIGIMSVGKESNEGRDVCVAMQYITPGTIRAIETDDLAAALNIHQPRQSEDGRGGRQQRFNLQQHPAATITN